MFEVPETYLRPPRSAGLLFSINLPTTLPPWRRRRRRAVEKNDFTWDKCVGKRGYSFGEEICALVSVFSRNEEERRRWGGGGKNGALFVPAGLRLF
ncbi:hypothetical protein NL676_020135 [Syzygium grande]|nr:hypothetical protein NL676_020135 [Syzygium grande]